MTRSACRAREGEGHEFPEVGVNLQVIPPGRPNCMYHRETVQEDFLVLSGECLRLVDGEQRPLSAWDFVHCPAGVDHVFVGRGGGPCVMHMLGARGEGSGVVYPVSELAAGQGASVEHETPSPREANAAYPDWKRGAVDDTHLPWAGQP